MVFYGLICRCVYSLMGCVLAVLLLCSSLLEYVLFKDSGLCELTRPASCVACKCVCVYVYVCLFVCVGVSVCLCECVCVLVVCVRVFV